MTKKYEDLSDAFNVEAEIVPEKENDMNVPVISPDGAKGNNMTSRIEGESVNNITKRSIPIPSPAVGGNPYSRAVI